MFTTQGLAKNYGMTYKRIHDRLTALGPLIDPHIVDGKNNTKYLKDSGRAILDRLIQLEKDGLTIAAAKAVIEKELADGGSPSMLNGSSNGSHLAALFQQMQARLDEQGQQITFLQGEISGYRGELGELKDQVRLMLPDPTKRNRKPKPWLKFWPWLGRKSQDA